MQAGRLYVGESISLFSLWSVGYPFLSPKFSLSISLAWAERLGGDGAREPTAFLKQLDFGKSKCDRLFVRVRVELVTGGCSLDGAGLGYERGIGSGA